MRDLQPLSLIEEKLLVRKNETMKRNSFYKTKTKITMI